jgi:SAM-dependent methyltransferase
MELSILERRFDLIKCVGVFHRMRDPLAGWKILTDLLRPGGIMRIGLYSEAARQCVVDGRARIVDDGYTTSPEDIRRCRQDFVAMAEDGNPNMAKYVADKIFSV